MGLSAVARGYSDTGIESTLCLYRADFNLYRSELTPCERCVRTGNALLVATMQTSPMKKVGFHLYFHNDKKKHLWFLSMSEDRVT